MSDFEPTINTTAEIAGENFSIAISNFSLQITKVADNEFNFGILHKDEIKTLYEMPERVYLSKISLAELVEIKTAMNRLIERIEEAANESFIK